MNSDDQGAAIGADGGVDDGQMNRPGRKRLDRPLQCYRPLHDVTGRNRVGDIDQARGRGVAEQNCLHGGDVPVVEPEVGGEGYNRNWQVCDRRIGHERQDMRLLGAGQTSGLSTGCWLKTRATMVWSSWALQTDRSSAKAEKAWHVNRDFTPSMR